MSLRADGFRKDIQGLRGLAILLVVAFHAKVPFFGKGFVGVDVFFVISGFLITRLLRREMDAGTFSFGNFYVRRARRLLPALLVVLVACLGFGWLVLPTEAYRALGKHTVAATLFSSNLSFYRETGYFEVGSEFKPLLMTWSLAVEEQFYCLWPCMLYAAFRRGWSGRRLAVVLFVISLAVWVALGMRHAQAAFFLLPGRAWELMVGSFLAFSPARAGFTRRGEVLSVVGFLAIVAAACAPLALPWRLEQVLAVAGAALIIRGASGGRFASHLLENRAFVYLGDISYSLYLWHAPALAFAMRTLLPLGGATFGERMFAVLGAFLVAVVSTKHIEKRFYQTKAAKPEKASTVLGRYGVASAFVAVLGVLIVATSGASGRFGKKEAAIAAYGGDRNPLTSVCMESIWSTQSKEFDPRCKISGDRARSMLLWGDSHALAIAPGFVELGRREGFGVQQQGRPACRIGDDRDPGCRVFNARMLAYALATPQVETVALVGVWSAFICNAVTASRCDPAAEALLEQRLTKIVDALKDAGKAVILLGDVPELTFGAVDCHLARLRFGWLFDSRDRSKGCTMPAAAVRRRLEPIHRILERIAATRPRVCAPRIADVLCDGERCHSSDGSRIFYVDDDHLTVTGAKKVVDALDLDGCLPIKAP